jgi:hypothetical protein
MLRKFTSLLLLVVFAATTLALPALADDENNGRGRARGNLAIPVTGGTAGSEQLGIPAGSAFTGTFYVQRFIADGGKLWALGTLVGTAAGKDIVVNGVQAETQAASLPTTASAAVPGAPEGFQLAQAPCPILNLTIGPINLNVLGLVVSIPNPIVVNIVAQPGPGNLLGNLLCAIAGLLNQTPTTNQLLQQIANLLNQILAALTAIA